MHKGKLEFQQLFPPIKRKSVSPEETFMQKFFSLFWVITDF